VGTASRRGSGHPLRTPAGAPGAAWVRRAYVHGRVRRSRRLLSPARAVLSGPIRGDRRRGPRSIFVFAARRRTISTSECGLASHYEFRPLNCRRSGLGPHSSAGEERRHGMAEVRRFDPDWVHLKGLRKGAFSYSHPQRMTTPSSLAADFRNLRCRCPRVRHQLPFARARFTRRHHSTGGAVSSGHTPSTERNRRMRVQEARNRSCRAACNALHRGCGDCHNGQDRGNAQRRSDDGLSTTPIQPSATSRPAGSWEYANVPQAHELPGRDRPRGTRPAHPRGRRRVSPRSRTTAKTYDFHDLDRPSRAFFRRDRR